MATGSLLQELPSITQHHAVYGTHLSQQISDLVGVLSIEYVPQSTWLVAMLGCPSHGKVTTTRLFHCIDRG